MLETISFMNLAKISELNGICRWPHEWGYTKICRRGGQKPADRVLVRLKLWA